MTRAIEQAELPGSRIGQRFGVPAILVLFSVVFTVYVIDQHSALMSPIDEWVYLDYLDKLRTGHIPRLGEPIGPEALARMACNGVFPYGPMGPGCTASHADVSTFPAGGITTADAYTPLFFLLTAAVGGFFKLLLPVDQLTAWRLTGAVWLSGTVCALFVLLRAWGVGRLTILALGLAFIASPYSWWTFTYVSTDAPSVLMGALLLLAATRHVRGRPGSWWVPVLAVVAMLFKVTNVLAVCLVALYLLAAWRHDARLPRRSVDGPWWKGLPRLPFVTLAVAGAVEVAWLLLHRAMAVGKTADQGISTALTVPELLWQIYNPLSALIANHVISGTPGTLALNIPGGLDRPLVWICVAGVIGLFWTMPRRGPEEPLVESVALASVTFGPMLALVLAVATGSYFPLPSRYGASIVPGFLLLAGLAMRDRRAAPILLGYAFVLYAVTLYYTGTITVD